MGFTAGEGVGSGTTVGGAPDGHGNQFGVGWARDQIKTKQSCKIKRHPFERMSQTRRFVVKKRKGWTHLGRIQPFLTHLTASLEAFQI